MSAVMTRASAAPSARRTAVGLAVLVAAQAMVLVDEMIVNIALPGLSEALATTPTQLSWVLNAYLLTFGGLLLLGGRAGDILGRRRVFLVGVALFTVASLARGLAPDVGTLIATRAVQGVGAALVSPSVLALIIGMYREAGARERAIAVYTAVGGVGAAVGLLLAGVFTSVGSWRWVLALNAPVGLVVLAAAPFVLRETVRAPGRFDLAGALTSAFGVAALVWALSGVGTTGWGDPLVQAAAAVGVAALVVFVVVERRARQPIVTPGLLADRGRGTAYLAVLVVQGAQIGQLYFLTQFLQQAMGYSAMLAAVSFLPVTATLLGLAGVAVRVSARFGPRLPVALGALALVASNLLLSRLDLSAGYAVDVLPALLLLGAGIAFGTIPATIAGTSGVAETEYGAASSVVTTVTAVGASLALATLVTVMTTAAEGAADPFTEGMSAAFVAGAAFAAATLLVALLMPRRGART
ncbi:MFS transporter [Actinokineospora bangkokensis]|uniref:Major facilitator superfamily (MFS) profile domain-containing protein n=1 Tax=Actinokineospora bangkokensis TaxID=1193682 RepID=A0A1Q9LC35_9PSEU|nr:MFS transporter [Actinokineospora bangkokensis]OLR89597.1 hypothetical protein BJP25_05915 [Actinokineospora bangkokensis]